MQRARSRGNAARRADGNRPMSYHEVPPEVLEDRERLRAWAERSAAVSRRKARKRK